MPYFIKSQILKKYFIIILLAECILPANLSGMEMNFKKEDTLLISNIIGLSAITTWGVLNWDYFKNDPQKKDEGWFSDDTKDGGHDKLGHFYFTYALSHALAAIYTKAGYTPRQGALLGSLSSFGMSSWMEIGDAFSSYGFSYEDFIMNLIGSMTGYLFYSYPAIAEKIDIRLEYRPKFDTTDFSTDYENQKFLMALKFDGFEFAQKNYFKYLELHLGYYTTGYPDKKNRERNIYTGIGINFSRLLKQAKMPKISKVFNYIQLPYTYIKIDKNLNK
jgi:uncharacterized protein YfiM (DUF2279 family)